MNCHLWANPPPGQFYTGLAVGLLVVAALIGAFLRRPADSSPRRVVTFIVAALVTGPLFGVALAMLVLVIGDVHPLERMHYLQSFTIIGTMAGGLASVMIALIAHPRIHVSTKGRHDTTADRKTDA